VTHRLMQYFEYKHLPRHLQETSAMFHTLAQWVDDNIPDNSEKTTALRKLLEAKDCAVRAHLYQEPTS
jgi:ferritin-like protein